MSDKTITVTTSKNSDKKITVNTTPKNRIVVTKGGSYSGIDTLVELKDVDASNTSNNFVPVYDGSVNKFVIKEVPFVNSSFQTANAAFDKANAANVFAYTVGINANAWANTKVSSVLGTSGQIYSSGGTTPTLNLITTGVTARTYGAANQIPVFTVDAFGRLTAAANVAVEGMNYVYANSIGASSNAWANTIGTAGNAYTVSVGAASNAWSNAVGASSNAWTNVVGTAGNNYSIAVGASSNAWTNTVGLSSNNFAGVMANSANAYSVSIGVAGNNYSISVGSAANSWTNAVGTAGNSYIIYVGASSNAWTNSVNVYSDATYFKKTGGQISGDTTITGNLTVGKDFRVTGNVYFVDQQTLRIADPLIYLAGNNYTTDLVDIGFVANYVNTTGSNVHTGLYRSFLSKQYYLFQEYNKEPDDNYIDYAGNNFTLAALNTNLITSNLILGGANAISWINASFSKANNALANTSGVSFAGDLYFPTGNVGIGTAPSSSYKLDVNGPVASLIGKFVNRDSGNEISYLDRQTLSLTKDGVVRWSDWTSVGSGANFDTQLNRYSANTICIGNSTSNTSGRLLVGSIGIGTTTPTANLDVSTGGGGAGFKVYKDYLTYIAQPGGQSCYWDNTGLAINSSVGRNYNLYVNGTGYFGGRIYLQSSIDFTTAGGEAAKISSPSSDVLVFSNSGGERLRINSSGFFQFNSGNIWIKNNDANNLYIGNNGAGTTSQYGISIRPLSGEPGLRVSEGIALGQWSQDGYQDLFLLRTAAATLQLGAADAATAVAQILQVQSVVAGTTNTAGATFTIRGSRGTGTGAGGSINFQLAPAGSTGSTQNPLVTSFTIQPGSRVRVSSGSMGVAAGGSQSGTGFYSYDNTCFVFGQDAGSSSWAGISNEGIIVASDKYFAFGSTTNVGSAPDTFLYRDAVNVIAQRKGTAGQTLRIYGTYTDASNHERLRISANTTGHYIVGEEAGTGLGRPLYLGANNSVAMTIDASSNVGIANTSPSSKLEVSNGYITTSGTSSGIIIKNQTDGATNYRLTSPTTGVFKLWKNNDSANVFTINDSAFFGFNVENPTVRVDVSGAVKASTYGEFGSYLSAGGTNPLIMNGNAYYGTIQWIVSDTWGLGHTTSRFGNVVGNTALSWSSTGNVGIGTTSPSEILTVSKSSSGVTVFPHLFLENLDGTDGGVRFYADGDGGGGIITFGSRVSTFAVANGRPSHLTTDHPGRKAGIFNYQNGTTNDTSAFLFGNSDAGTNQPIGWKVAITANGRIGVGTTLPNSTLQVAGTANITSNLVVQGYDVVPTMFALANACNNWANSISTGGSSVGNSTNTQVIFNNNGYANGSNDLLFIKGEGLLIANVISSNTMFVGRNQMDSTQIMLGAAGSYTIDKFLSSSAKAVQYNLVFESEDRQYHSTQISLLHNDGTSYITEYATLYTGNNLATITSSLSSMNVYLNVATTYANTVVNIFRVATGIDPRPSYYNALLNADGDPVLARDGSGIVLRS